MSAASFSPYIDNTQTVVFTLASESPNGVKYLVSGRGISVPFTLEISRKLTASNAAGNDEVTVLVRRLEQNGTSGKLATMFAKLIISIPKDTSIITATVQKQLISIIASLLNQSTAMEATNTFITALIEGRNP